MSIALMTGIIIASFLITLVLGLPVAFTLIGLFVILAAIFINPSALYAAYASLFNTSTKDIFIAVPLFVFMATVLQYSGLGSALYDTMYKWFGGFRGGLAIGTVALCTLIAAMTGLGGTGILTIGYLAFPEMEKRGYNRMISLGCIPPAGSLGPLIPPSVIMIVLGGFTSLSIGKLFMGGVFPGLLMSVLFMAYIAIRCWVQPHMGPALPVEERATWKEKVDSLRGVILPIILIFIVLGTIYTGITTPTEAGGVGAFGALVCAAIYRKLNWENLKKAAFSAIKLDCMVMWILIGGHAFSSLLLRTGVSQFISDATVGVPLGPMAILIIMLLINLVMGMFIDSTPIIMITIPIFMPVVLQLGIDPLWFALLFTICLIVGYVSPPFGMCLFYMKGIVPRDVPMGQIYRAVTPFVLLQVLVVIAGILFPQLLLWLPNMMIK